MARSSYAIRVAGTVPLDLLQNFPQINAVECAGTILRATQLDEVALWGLINALRAAATDLVEVRRELGLTISPAPPPIAVILGRREARQRVKSRRDDGTASALDGVVTRGPTMIRSGERRSQPVRRVPGFGGPSEVP